MSPHRVLVPLQHDGALHRIGEIIDFEGSVWSLEPVDPDARERWARTMAEPERVRVIQERLAGYPEATAAWLAEHKGTGAVAGLPPSGPAASGAG